MRLVQSQEVDARDGCRSLLLGELGKPDHYELTLRAGRRDEQRRHRRYGYDQVWFDLGAQVRYVGEGTYHDPRELSAAAQALVLHCGGESGNGYPAPGRACAEPRYDGPVVMHTTGFAWPRATGRVQQRMLGVFSERGLKIGLLRVAAGTSTTVAGRGAPRVLYSLSGSGTVNGRRWRDGAALGIAAAEAVTMRADEDAEWFFVRLQRFDA
jgi:hypothetical protein